MGLLLIKKKQNPDCANSFGIDWKTLEEPNECSMSRVTSNDREDLANQTRS